MSPKRPLRAMLLGALALFGAGTAWAQLLPQGPVGGVLDGLGRIGSEALGTTLRMVEGTARTAKALANARLDRLQRLVRANGDLLEMTVLGPAVKGEIVAVDPEPAVIDAALDAGFEIVSEERIEGLHLRSVTLAVPRGFSVDRAMALLTRIAPGGEFAPNHLHLQSGRAAAIMLAGAAAAQGGGAPARIGIIDGGVAAHPSLGNVEQRGFVAGAPAPSAHGTAVASLAVGRSPMRSAAPGEPLLVADVYGRDPKGGNAVAIARALGFLADRRVKVIGMSLVGPPNPLVAKAIGQAMARGIHVVAAVGNDGPAAPPAFPASYKGVVAVTGVDGRDRALVEAGRSLHLDFAAPGADLAAASARGGLVPVRGTSYAVPLVAARLARASLDAIASEARDLGPKGPDTIYGRGLVCGACRTPIGKK